MQSDPIIVDISSERDLPIRLVTIVEEITSKPIGSSSIPKKKRKAQNTISLVPQNRQTRTSTRVAEEAAWMGPSSSGVVDSTTCVGVSIEDIPGFIQPCQPGA